MPAITTVYFATNRLQDASGFGAQIVDRDDTAQVFYAVTEVDGIVLDKEGSGKLQLPRFGQKGGFADAIRDQIVAAGKNLLFFIHGFDNAFEDAIKRAAFNREWFAASGRSQADTTVVAFTWPSAGKLLPDTSQPPQDAYLADQAMAYRSALHIAEFLRQGLQLASALKAGTPSARAFLLAHSMGNHALAGAVEAFFASGMQAATLFDEVILAAADEAFDTLVKPDGSGMTRLRNLAARISVYSSQRDVAMEVSMAVNHNMRLGYRGPMDESNVELYPLNNFRCVDCTEVFDFLGAVPPDATHQYYRRSKRVRDDITALMGDENVAAGVSKLRALPF